MHHDTIIIGGGQAGLAIGRLLAERGHDFTILEAADEPAAAWRSAGTRCGSSHQRATTACPANRCPGEPDHYPTREEVVAYLTEYARDLPVQPASRVHLIDSGRNDGRLHRPRGVGTSARRCQVPEGADRQEIGAGGNRKPGAQSMGVSSARSSAIAHPKLSRCFAFFRDPEVDRQATQPMMTASNGRPATARTLWPPRPPR